MKTRVGQAARQRGRERAKQRESAALSATAREREPPLDYLCALHAATQMAGQLPCASETATGHVRQGKVRQGGREERRVLARITHQPSPHFASPISLATRLALSTSLSLSHPVSLPLDGLLSVSLSHPLSLWPAQTSRYLMHTSSHRRAQSVVVDRNERYVSFLLLYILQSWPRL